MTERLHKFKGFPPGKSRMTPLPAQFFADLLPLVDDLAELKVTLFCFWALHQKEGDFRYLRLADFENDDGLMRGLAAVDAQSPPESILDAALVRAVERETLLTVTVPSGDETEHLYFLNTVLGREAIRQVKAGKWKPGAGDTPVEILPGRPNLYALYEANIGALTPHIADRLKDAESEYPEHWLEEAIKLAVEKNARHWRYIHAILDRWEREGRSREITGGHDQPDGKRYTSGEYSDFIES